MIVLPALKAALARGNDDFIRYELNELLQVFRINLDPNCLDYRKLALAVMKHGYGRWRLSKRGTGASLLKPLRLTCRILR